MRALPKAQGNQILSIIQKHPELLVGVFVLLLCLLDNFDTPRIPIPTHLRSEEFAYES
jgi:hypothetical protein